jgi:hypothetical protein
MLENTNGTIKKGQSRETGVEHLFRCCPIMFLYVLSSILWSPLRYPHKNDVRLNKCWRIPNGTIKKGQSRETGNIGYTRRQTTQRKDNTIPVLLCFFTFWVPYCEVRYDIHIKTMFGLSLPPVVRTEKRYSRWREERTEKIWSGCKHKYIVEGKNREWSG